MAKAPKAERSSGKPAHSYLHPIDTVPMRPEIGTQANFRKKKVPPRTDRYDSSLSPALEWDGAVGRELAEWLICVVERASALPAPHAFAKPEEFKDAGGATLLSVSSLQDEGLGGQVQMIYIDPPYGVKFGSNCQPFVRKRDVSHGDDEDLTREPERR